MFRHDMQCNDQHPVSAHEIQLRYRVDNDAWNVPCYESHHEHDSTCMRFPVMTAVIGLPFIMVRFHGDPAIMGAIAMLSGFCGTLVMPMAANFNIVPAALLGLDRNAVIRAQWPTALLLLLRNTLLMYFLVFRFGSHHT
jgi:hypothetical protein